jgi:hypothetical protein
MQVTSITVDNFYSNADAVRAFALSQPFDVKGNYPGARTKTFINDGVKNTIQQLIQHAGGKVTNWFDIDGLTGSFQIATAMDRTWIHSDNFNTWAAVCYLTPDAPLSSGTGLYRHKATGQTRPLSRQDDTNYNCYDYTKWEMTDRVGNVYNRLIMYRGDLFHASLDYFGDNLENGRLFQVFFFDTEY